jgi:hypothetical protein
VEYGVVVLGVNTRLGEGNNILGSPGQGEGNFEIGRILHLKSEIPKTQIGLASV